MVIFHNFRKKQATSYHICGQGTGEGSLLTRQTYQQSTRWTMPQESFTSISKKSWFNLTLTWLQVWIILKNSKVCKRDSLRRYVTWNNFISSVPDGSQSLHVYGVIPDARSAMFDIWRDYEDIRVSDVAYYLRLNHSRLIVSSLLWRPDLKHDIQVIRVYAGTCNCLFCDYCRLEYDPLLSNYTTMCWRELPTQNSTWDPKPATRFEASGTMLSP